MIHLLRVHVLAIVAGFAVTAFSSIADAQSRPPEIGVSTEVPELEDWAKSTQKELIAWYPRVVNLLPTNGVRPNRHFSLHIKKSDEGVGYTSGGRITVMSGWIEKHPEDVGLAIHEMVHVIQGYPSPEPVWVTEGIADYIRWGIYEGKPLAAYPRPREPQGYKRAYQVTAGFFLWLEGGPAPGIVNRLNTAMRKREYSDEIFKEVSGKTLDELWDEYVKQGS